MSDDALREEVAKVMTDYGVDFYEGNLRHRTEQRLALIEDFKNDILAIITLEREAADRAARVAELEDLPLTNVHLKDGGNIFAVTGEDLSKRLAQLQPPSEKEDELLEGKG